MFVLAGGGIGSGLVYANLWPLFVEDPADYSAQSQHVDDWYNMLIQYFI